MEPDLAILNRPGKGPQSAGLLALAYRVFRENSVNLYRDLQQSSQAEAVLRTTSHDRAAATAALSFTPSMLAFAAMHNSNAAAFEVGLIIRVRHP